MVELTHEQEVPRWIGTAVDSDDAEAVDLTQSNGISMRVTATHTMLVRTSASDCTDTQEYCKKKAGELVSADPSLRIQMRAAAPAGQPAPLSLEELPFVRQLGLRAEEEVAAFLELYGQWQFLSCVSVFFCCFV
jgi:hypothetical protein